MTIARTPHPWVQPVTLVGAYVRLEPLAVHHAAGLHHAAEPSLFRFTPQGPAVWSVEGFADQIRHINSRPNMVAFAVVDRRSESVIGRTAYMEIRPEHKSLEIGTTWISVAFQGTSINPEMKLLMLHHAFEVLGAERVQLCTGSMNLQSQRAIAKLGAIREATLKSDRIQTDGCRRDTVMFSIIRTEWPKIEAGLKNRLSSYHET